MQAGPGGVPFLQLLTVIVKVELHVALHDLLAPGQEALEQLEAHPLQGVCSSWVVGACSCCPDVVGGYGILHLWVWQRRMQALYLCSGCVAVLCSALQCARPACSVRGLSGAWAGAWAIYIAEAHWLQ